VAALLHARLVVAEDTRERIVAFLQDHVGVTNIVVVRGAAVQPAGDLVLFDVARESANEVLRVLQAAGVHHAGSIDLEHVELSLGRAAAAAQAAAPGEAEATVLWAEVDEAVDAAGRWSAGYLAYFLVAAVITAVAILVDSTVLLVGGMVVGPEFGPLVAVSLALERGRWGMLRRATVALVGGTVAGVAASLALALVLRALGRIPDTYTSGARPLTRFVSEPDEFSAIVACAAAVAGVLALTQERAGALVGVLVSVTTLPAIAAAGVALAVGDGGEVLGSLSQLGINVACLVGVGALTLRVLRRLTPRTLTALAPPRQPDERATRPLPPAPR